MIVSIIGAGKVGNCLTRLFQQKSIDVELISGRDILGIQSARADLAIFALADRAYAEIIPKIKVSFKNAVHTSGSLPLELLKPIAENYGVFYPYNSISKPENYALNLCLEASNTLFLKSLEKTAKIISEKVFFMDSEERAKLHLAAVFAQNFTNYLYTVAEDLTPHKSLILELIQHHTELLKTTPAKLLQTGPAIRRDDNIIQAHLRRLENPDDRELYRLLTRNIQKKHEL